MACRVSQSWKNTTGIQAHIEVKPSYGLDDSQIANMLTAPMQ